MKNGLPIEVEKALVKALIEKNYGTENSDALVEFVFAIFDYRKLTFQEIINKLQDVRVCPVCEEATFEKFMVDTEGMVDGGYGMVCDFCANNGR